MGRVGGGGVETQREATAKSLERDTWHGPAETWKPFHPDQAFGKTAKRRQPQNCQPKPEEGEDLPWRGPVKKEDPCSGPSSAPT